MTSPPPRSAEASTADQLRALAATWAVAAVLPLPVLVATAPPANAFMACVYLGLASAWLVAEFGRTNGLPTATGPWGARTRAVLVVLSANVALFTASGLASDIHTHIPLPLMAALSALPAVGILPWIVRRVRDPYAAIILGSALLLAVKLAACVVARLVYGPDFVERGYVAADWRTAKLMISLFWAATTLLSLGLLIADYRICRALSRVTSAD
jgi:hypothetical protein